MTLTRALVFLLLLANIGLVALLAGPLQDANPFSSHAGEPERLSNQLNPERIAVSAPLPSPGIATAAITTQAEPAAANSEPLAAASEPAPELSCLMYDGLTPDQLQAISSAARSIGPQISLKEKAASPASYWVHLPPQPDREEANRRVDALKAAGVEELFVVQDGGAMQNAISLGVYRNEASAKRQLEALQKKGVQGVRMNTRDAGRNGQIELSASVDTLARFRREADSILSGLASAKCAGN